MASQPQTQGQLQDFLTILRRRAWQIVLPCAFGVAVGTFVVSVMPKSYTVNTQLEVHEMNPPIGSRTFEATSISREIGTAGWMIRAIERVRAVVEKQEWQDYAGLSRDEQTEYITKLTSRITVPAPIVSKTQQGSQFIRITYSDSEPQRAAQFLNDLRDAYVHEIVTRGRERAKADRQTLQEMRKEKENIYNEAQRRLTEINKQYKLSVTQPAPGSGKERAEDPIFTLLQSNKVKLNEAELALKNEKAKNASLHEQLEREPADVPDRTVSPGVSVDARIATIDTDIATLKKTIDSSGWLPLHSGYQKAQDEIRSLEDQKKQILGLGTISSVETHYKPNERKNALQLLAEASDQKLAEYEASVKTLEANVKDLQAKQMELTDVYRQVNGLATEFENAKNNFADADVAYQRQKDFYEYISGPPGNPFEVIERAEAPREPTSPIVPLVIAMYGAIGLALGLATSILAEFGRNAFRSVGDVSRSMSVPVLGAVGEIITRGELRNRTVRRAAIGLASLVLIGSVLWVTWAFSSRQDLLSADLRDAIHALQEKLR
ncbi:MAG: hypothetical protein K8S98_12095 [Planctomycetes bacterium]|nr:hypothetical protein [Planctomycetota bacterium]